jgi:hypothetical protein
MAWSFRRTAALAIFGLSAAVAGFGACKDPETLGPPRPPDLGGGGAGGDPLPGNDGGPPPLDAGGLCGNQLHRIISDAPNVYFVLDASGSMNAPVADGSTVTRYQRVRKAAIQLVEDLGALIHVGVALFPHEADEVDPCAIGAQVMAVAPGDPEVGGGTTQAFKNKTNIEPFGGTPTAATLADLRPGLAALPGRTFVLLVTDGGPNCNADAACGGDGCQYNIEGCTGDSCCDPGGNCCAPGAPVGPEGCLDSEATLAAVKAYADSELPLYVIGIPGSEVYEDLLAQMAITAGTAQFAKPFYYAVGDLDNLNAVLSQIAASAISCIFEVEDSPPVPDQTNVYLDGVVLPADLQDGWRWMDPDLTRIELLGEACDKLKTGKVKSVQIVSGCPTEPPK